MTANHLQKLGCITAFGFLLSGCSFQPVYGSHGGKGSPVAEQLSQVAIDPIPERPGQILRNDLIDNMYGKSGRPTQPAYHLKVKLNINEEDLGLLVNATAALAAVHTYGNYTLEDNNGKILASGTTHSTASYDKLTSEYSTLTARESALERTVHELSEQLTARVSLYFSEHAPAP
jgi:LPS-assembly lipoprotein